MFRFLHAADLHLDSPLRELERYEGAPVEAIRQASRRALEKLVEMAIEERVRFVLICGDVYDSNLQDVKTGLFFVHQLARLREHGISVFLIAGNHDAANRMTRRLPYPDNVYSFQAEKPYTVHLDDLRVAIHGQSYAEQKEMRNLASGYPPPDPGYFNIGLLHTGIEGREGHERYAPCRVDELIASAYDYWALGHIHQRESVNGEKSPRIEFPGNIQGRQIRETGAKGCLLVHVDASHNPTVEFRPLDVFRWDRAEVDCTGAEDREEVVQRVDDTLDEILADSDCRPLAVRIELNGCCPVHDALLVDYRNLSDEIRALSVGKGAEKIWVEKIKVWTSRVGTEAIDPALGDDALSELTNVINDLRSNQALLQSILDKEEVKHLQGRLPPELRDDGAPIQLTDPVWAAPLLDRVQAILTQAATTKVRTP
jgi:DNA repair protein SbcD/Mre11